MKGVIIVSVVCVQAVAEMRRKTPQEVLRQNQRALNRTMRELDRERSRLEQQEKKLIVDIKKMATKGEMDVVKVMAKDLVRTRGFVKKFIMMRANIQAVSLKIQTLKSQDLMSQAMKKVTRTMMIMNKRMNLAQMQKIIMEFERQTEIMDTKQEMMDEAIDGVMGGEEDEDESDAVVGKVLDELGIQLADQLANLPAAANIAGPPERVNEEPAPVMDADAQLQERLDRLRRR